MQARTSDPRVAGHRRRWSRAVLALACLGVLAPTASAGLWKWVDANGHVVYSDIPPSGDVKAERVNAPAPPANPNAAKELANQEVELKKRQMERTEQAAKQAKARATDAHRQEVCAQARSQEKALQLPNVQHYRVDERGDRVLMDAAMKRKELERVEKFVREQCKV